LDKRVRPFIVPIFIPNLGCPYRCIFCDQRRITGQSKIRIGDIKEIIDTAVRSKRFHKEEGMEVAFYGGTFTTLPTHYMIELLEAVRPYTENGIVKKIRVSTRPDALNKEILSILKKYGVNTVELGAQSLNDDVLRLSKRGHSAKHTVDSFFLLKEMGFNAGIQLMLGLPGDSREVFLDTIKKVISLKPDMVRLYPTLVIKGTELEALYKAGKYTPISLDEAVDICAEACSMLEKEGIPVIRIGLMNSKELLKNIVAGPWHPAFGFLVRSRIYIKENVIPALKWIKEKDIKIFTHPNNIPLIRGYKNQGLSMIESETGIRVSKVIPDSSLYPEGIRVEGI